MDCVCVECCYSSQCLIKAAFLEELFDHKASCAALITLNTFAEEKEWRDRFISLGSVPAV